MQDYLYLRLNLEKFPTICFTAKDLVDRYMALAALGFHLESCADFITKCPFNMEELHTLKCCMGKLRYMELVLLEEMKAHHFLEAKVNRIEPDSQKYFPSSVIDALKTKNFYSNPFIEYDSKPNLFSPIEAKTEKKQFAKAYRLIPGNVFIIEETSPNLEKLEDAKESIIERRKIDKNLTIEPNKSIGYYKR